MSVSEHNVRYKALADFSSLITQARLAREELRKLRDEQERGNRGSGGGDGSAELRRRTQATQEATRASRDLTISQDENARSSVRATTAQRQLREEFVRSAVAAQHVRAAHLDVATATRRMRAENEQATIGADRHADAQTRLAASLQGVVAASAAAAAAGSGTPSGGGGLGGLVRRLTGSAGGGSGTPPTSGSSSGGGGSAASGNVVVKQLLGGLEKFGSAFPVKIAAVLSAIGPLITAVGSLGAVVLAAGSMLGSLAASTAALPGLFFAAATGIGALVTVMGPISAAFKAYGAQQQAITDSGLGENQKQLADQMRQASRAVQVAERGIAESQYAAKLAQKGLTDARREALRTLEDLRREVQRASLDEEGATLGLKRAQDDYLKSLNDPNATLLDRVEALHRVKEAELSLGDVQQRNRRNAEDLRREESKGVEGSDSVQAARRGVMQANQGVIDSNYQLAEANRELAKAQRDTASGGSAVVMAQQKLDAALNKLSPSTRAVAVGLMGMSKSWQEVQKGVSEKLFAPLVGQLGNMKSFLPVINDLLGESASAVGELSAKAIAMVTSGPWTADFRAGAKVNAEIIRNMSTALLLVMDAFRNLAVAAIPFTTWITVQFVKAAKASAEWAAEGRRTGSIAEGLDRVRVSLGKMFTIVGNVFSVFRSWNVVSRGFTDWLLDALIRVTGRWKDTAKAQEAATSPLRKWLEDVKPLLASISGLIGGVSAAFASMSADPKNIERTTAVFKILKDEILPPLVRLLDTMSQSGALESIGKAVGQLLTALDKFIAAGGAKAVETFFRVLGNAVEVLSRIASMDVVVDVLGGVAIAFGAIAAIALVGKFTGLIWLFGRLAWLVANGGAIRAALSSFFGIGGSAGAAGTADAAANPQLSTVIGLLQKIQECVCKAATNMTKNTPVPVNLAKDAAPAAAGASLLGPIIAIAVGAAITAFAAKTAVDRSKTDKAGDLFKPTKDFLAKPTVGGYVNATLSNNPIALIAFEIGRFFNSGTAKKIGRWFTETLPEAVGEFGRGLERWFTETLPKAVSDFFGGLGIWFTETLPTTLGVALGTFYGTMLTFWTVTVPGILGEFYTFMWNFWTVTVPLALAAFYTFMWNFWTVTVPLALAAFYTFMWNFWTVTVPLALAAFYTFMWNFWTVTVPNAVIALGAFLWNFWTVTVPLALAAFYTFMWNFWTVTVPNAVMQLGTFIWNFWTVTVPNAVGQFGDFIWRFFSETLPGYVPEFAKKFWEGFKSGWNEHAPGWAKMAKGGKVQGTGSGDHVPILGEPGEFMITKQRVGEIGDKFFEDINAGLIDPQQLYAALNMIAGQGMVMPAMFPGSAPSVSSGEKSTTDNSSRVGLQIGDVTINNPVAEKSASSLRRQLQIYSTISDR